MFRAGVGGTGHLPSTGPRPPLILLTSPSFHPQWGTHPRSQGRRPDGRRIVAKKQCTRYPQANHPARPELWTAGTRASTEKTRRAGGSRVSRADRTGSPGSANRSLLLREWLLRPELFQVGTSALAGGTQERTSMAMDDWNPGQRLEGRAITKARAVFYRRLYSEDQERGG